MLLTAVQTAWLTSGYKLRPRGAKILNHMPISCYESHVLHLEVLCHHALVCAFVHSPVLHLELWCLCALVVHLHIDQPVTMLQGLEPTSPLKICSNRQQRYVSIGKQKFAC